MKDYRLTQDEASTRDAWHIVNDVVFRIADDAPSLTDAAAIRQFLAAAPPIPSAVFAAWFTAGFAANGGLWHIFDCCAAPFISHAIEGYELLGEPYAASCLRRACAVFPNAIVPDSTDEAASFLDQLPADGFPSIVFERDQHIKDFFDLPAVFRNHPDAFVRNSDRT